MSSSLAGPFNYKIVSRSSLEIVSSKTILMKTHNCATSTISVGSSNVREKHSHASINFLSCYSTTFPSSTTFPTLSWPSRSVCYCCNFQKCYLVLRERLTSQYGHLVFSKDVTDVIGSNSCGFTLGSQFGED